MKEFFIPGLDQQVIQMRHDFHEARRQDLLAVVRHRRSEIIKEDGGSVALSESSSLAKGTLTKGLTSPKNAGFAPKLKKPGLIPPHEENPFEVYTAPGAPPFIAPFVNTHAFFKKWNAELDPNNEPPKAEQPKAANEKSSASLTSPLSPGSSQKLPQSRPRLFAGEFIQTPAMFREDPDEENFLKQVKHMRICDGNSRVEHDFAKNTENHLVVLRNDEARSRGAQQNGQKTIVTKRNKMQVHAYQRLMNDYLENRDKREHRETQQRPSHLPRNVQHDARMQIVFLSNVDAMSNVIKRQNDHLKEGTDIDHSRVEKLAHQHIIKKMSVAQGSMAERLRWRENHHEKVTVAGAQFEEEKLRLFLQREEDLKRRRAVADNRGFLRKELNRCRQINRDSNEELRTRKGAFLKDQEQWLKAEKYGRTLSPQSTLTHSHSLPALSSCSSPLGHR
jgi:hypothetical protein